MNTIKAEIILDTRRKKIDNKYPVKLQIYFNRNRKHYTTKYDLTKEEFKKVMGDKPRNDFKTIRESLDKDLRDAQNVISGLKVFTISLFERNMFRVLKKGGAVGSFYEATVKELRENGQIGTAISYECSLASITKFQPQLGFEHITPAFLEKYESWMLKGGNSLTTVGIYLRNLRAIFKRAISDNIVSTDIYPFGRYRYIIPAGSGIKKALNAEEIERIFLHEIEEGTAMGKARDYWCFSYLCNGMNMADIARLRNKDLSSEHIHYERKKTLRTNRGNSEIISIPLHSLAKSIIQKLGNPNSSPDAYIFPVLKKGMTPEQEKATVQQLVKTVNKYMKRLGEKLGIKHPLTTYVARHSFATALKINGASIPLISEALGHSNESTTRKYLASFGDEAKKKYSEQLTPFLTSSE